MTPQEHTAWNAMREACRWAVIQIHDLQQRGTVPLTVADKGVMQMLRTALALEARCADAKREVSK